MVTRAHLNTPTRLAGSVAMTGSPDTREGTIVVSRIFPLRWQPQPLEGLLTGKQQDVPRASLPSHHHQHLLGQRGGVLGAAGPSLKRSKPRETHWGAGTTTEVGGQETAREFQMELVS